MWHMVRIGPRLRFLGNGPKYQRGSMLEVADGPQAAIEMSAGLAKVGVNLTVEEIADEMEQI